MGKSHGGNYDNLKRKLADKVRGLGIVPEGVSLVFQRTYGSAKCKAVNGLTGEDLGIVSRYPVSALFDDPLTYETDAAGTHWLLPKEE